MSHVSAEMRSCIQECQNCYSVCTETAIHCMQHGGAHAEANHVRLMLDCAEICKTSAAFMLRGSPLHARTCGVCAEVCEQCAADCDRFSDAFMKHCAQICRSCAESCRKMSAMTA